MTKDELFRHSASDIRRKPELFAEFRRLYVEDGYSLQGCIGCGFSNNFESWKSKHFKSKNIEIMESENSKNTFVIHRNYNKLYVPYINKVITKDSPDDLVLEFLNQDNGKYFDMRCKNFFEVLPESLREIKKEAENSEQVELEEKPRKKRVRRTKAQIQADKEKKSE